MSANILAVLAGIILGAAVLPWQIALGKVTPGQYLILQGVVYMIIGAISHFAESGEIPLLSISKSGLQWTVCASTIYAVAIWMVNKSFAVPGSSASLIGGIIAMYPAATIATESLINKRWPSYPTLLFAAVVMIGVVGLSLFGKKI